MNFERLSQLIPKKTKIWNVSDVQIWLNHLNFSTLCSRFRQHSVDGSCLKNISELQLTTQIAIKSSIVVNKLLKWIEVELQNFDNFLDSKNCQNDKIQISQLDDEHNIPTHAKKKSEDKLILLNKRTKKCFSIEKQAAIVDSGGCYEIFETYKKYPYEYTVVSKIQGSYYINPLFQQNSVCILLCKPVLVFDSMQLQVGNQKLQIHLIQGSLSLVGKGMHQKFLVQKDNCKIWKIPFIQDFTDRQVSGGEQILKIIKKGSQFWISSNSGIVWVNIQKKKFKIQQNTIFRLRKSKVQYCCNFFKEKDDKQIPTSTDKLCLLCCERQKNSLFLKCRHIAVCLVCSRNLKNCPICRTQIFDFIRIYHA